MNAFGYGVGKPDCEYSVAPLSIEWCSALAKAPRSVLKVASLSSERVTLLSTASVLESNELLKGCSGETKDILRLRSLEGFVASTSSAVCATSGRQ